MEYPKRKNLRLKEYDYSKVGAYFVTICTEGRKQILSEIIVDNIVGRDDPGTPNDVIRVSLTEIGKIAEKYINLIPHHYKNIVLDKYVIMPDHIHILLSLEENDRRRAESSRPTAIPQVIGALKRMIHKEIGHPIFQASFYDHIIRDEADYMVRRKYMEENPYRWAEREKGKS